MLMMIGEPKVGNTCMLQFSSLPVYYVYDMDRDMNLQGDMYKEVHYKYAN